MFHLVICRETVHAEAKIDAFLKTRDAPAVLRTRRRKKLVSHVAAIKSRVEHWPRWHAAGWILRAENDQVAEPEELPRRLFERSPPPICEERCRYLADRFDWAVVPWFGTFHESCLVFVSARAEPVDTFLACAEDAQVSGLMGRQPPAEPVVLSRYGPIDDLSSLCGLTLYDEGIEGRLTWTLAARDGIEPIVVCRIDGDSGTWWRPHLRRLEPIARRECKTPYGTELYDAFRATDRDAYDAIWKRSTEDDSIAEYAVSGRADPDAVLELMGRGATTLGEVQDVGDTAGWAYTQCYGGASSERHAVFWAADASSVRVVASFIDGQETDRARVYVASRF